MDLAKIETDVLTFWFADGPAEKRAIWFQKNSAFDAEIEQKFRKIHTATVAGDLSAMAETPLGCLALIIILDQFPRNLFRDDGRSFATDGEALGLARTAIEKGFGQALSAVQRQFLYMPYQHSENLKDQRQSVTLFKSLGEESYSFAMRHLEIIERFGRFPHRNTLLGRNSTDEEIQFLTEPDSSF
jgi:uncharacterized protein (DUF924 family)